MSCVAFTLGDSPCVDGCATVDDEATPLSAVFFAVQCVRGEDDGSVSAAIGDDFSTLRYDECAVCRTFTEDLCAGFDGECGTVLYEDCTGQEVVFVGCEEAIRGDAACEDFGHTRRRARGGGHCHSG